MLKSFARALGIGYLIGLMSFLGAELHARENRGHDSDDAIRVPSVPANARMQLERLKVIDALISADVKRQIDELRAEVASLRKTVEVARGRGGSASRDLSRGSLARRVERRDDEYERYASDRGRERERERDFDESAASLPEPKDYEIDRD